MDNLEFYTVCHSKMDSLNRGISSVNQEVNLLTSYSKIYKNPTKPIELPPNRKKLMIDSGAYDFLIREENDDFPFSPKEYAHAIKTLDIKPDIVVSMDYICSREEKNNNLELIEKTIKNAEILKKDFIDSDDIVFMPVIQGNLLEEYLYCVKKMVNRYIIQEGDYIGIGSLVGRRKLKETRAIIRSIYNFLKEEILDFKIHCFGINQSIIKDKEIFNMVNSIDSLTWTFPYLYGRVKMFTREGLIEANTKGILKEPEFYYLSLDATLKYIDFLNLRFRNGFDYRDKNLINRRNQRKNYFFFYNLAKKILGNDNIPDKLKSVNDFIEYILDVKDKFPRESELKIDQIPAYTGKKLLFLESKTRKIGKREFIYLLLSAMENAHSDCCNNGDYKTFNNNMRSFFQKIENSEIELNNLKDCLHHTELRRSFERICTFNSQKNVPINFIHDIVKLKDNLTLKRYKFNNNYVYSKNPKEEELVILV